MAKMQLKYPQYDALWEWPWFPFALISVQQSQFSFPPEFAAVHMFPLKHNRQENMMFFSCADQQFGTDFHTAGSAKHRH